MAPRKPSHTPGNRGSKARDRDSGRRDDGSHRQDRGQDRGQDRRQDRSGPPRVAKGGHRQDERPGRGPGADSDSRGRPFDPKAHRDRPAKATKFPSAPTGSASGGHPGHAGQGLGGASGGGHYWIYGHHAVAAALANPRRRVQRILTIGDEAAAIGRGAARGDGPSLPPIEPTDRDTLDRLLGRDAVHQGLAARVAPLPETDIYEICDLAQAQERASVVVLDQVTDPHNVGAILRSAAAFGALAIILTERHAAPESGVLAKAASGALEHVPLARVTNLVRAMGALKEAGFWCLGLAADGRQTLAEVKPGGRVALCLGAEGTGLRRLTREHCDLLVRLPTTGPIDHLNVSNAAAISLYEMVR